LLWEGDDDFAAETRLELDVHGVLEVVDALPDDGRLRRGDISAPARALGRKSR
jgi:hypothetical protein